MINGEAQIAGALCMRQTLTVCSLASLKVPIWRWVNRVVWRLCKHECLIKEWAGETQVWWVWSTRSSHQGSHLFVWVLVWHNRSWNAIWACAFLSHHTKAKERMNCKINDLGIWIVSRLLCHKNKPCKDNLQTLIRPKNNFNGEQTGAEYRKKSVWFWAGWIFPWRLWLLDCDNCESAQAWKILFRVCTYNLEVLSSNQLCTRCRMAPFSTGSRTRATRR